MTATPSAVRAYVTAIAAAILKAKLLLILIALAETCVATFSHAQSAHMIGSWKIDITFTNGQSRSLRFNAQEGGKGTLVLLDPRSQAWGTTKAQQAKWTLAEGNSVTFSGPVEFPLGNVGRDPGTLMCRGKLETESLITGKVEFAPLVGEQPSKHGTFKASRVGADKK